AETNEYWLPEGMNYSRFSVQPDFTGARSGFKAFKDEELFELTKNSKYPDLFYRTRVGLSPIGVDYPPDVLVSFRTGYASRGFELPGKSDIATAGFHGAMEELASDGTLLTDERDIPEAVRSDNLLDLFPRLKSHIAERGIEYIEGDRNAL